MEEFDSQEVISLVEKALSEDLLHSGFTLPLAFNEGRLLEVLSEKLVTYLPIADVQVLLDDLRDELYSGLDLGTLKTLHTITRNCRKCPAMIPDPNLPKWNLQDPDVMFIAEQPLRTSDEIDLFVATLKTSGFNSNRVMLTYVNRCSVAEKRRATVDEINNCLGYLHHEIQLVKPKLLVPLGLLPTSTLLLSDIKLASERGKICWLGPWAIMPTYSLSYVLNGSEHLRETFEQDIKFANSFCYGVK